MATKSSSVLPEIKPVGDGETLAEKLNEAFGAPNWGWTVEAQFSGKESSGAVVTRGKFSAVLADGLTVNRDGVSAVPADGDLNQACQKGSAVALISALRNVGYKQIEFPELVWPEKKEYTPRHYGNKSYAKSEDVDSDSDAAPGMCSDCGNQITDDKTNAGAPMSADRIIKMTTESYGRALCWSCNKKAYAKSKNANKSGGYRR